VQKVTLTVAPATAPAVASISNISIGEGNVPEQIASFTIALTSAAPSGGAVVTLGGSRGNIIQVPWNAQNLTPPPTTVTVPAGSTTASVQAAITPFIGAEHGTILTATYNGVTQWYILWMGPLATASLNHTNPVLCASASLAPCLTAAALRRTPLTVSSDPARYYLYTPELQLMAETEQSTSATKSIAYSYLWFGGQPVAEIDTTTNTTRWYAVDHLGTPFLQADATGTVVWRAEYTAYGDIFAYRMGSTLHQPLRLSGQTTTDGNSLYNNVYRWYRSGWARYTQRDPIGIKGV
jgi:RHS repeat-associated protein